MKADQLLLIWQHLSGIDELNEALEHVAEYLKKMCDFDGIMVRRFDSRSNKLETVAEYSITGQGISDTNQNGLSQEGMIWMMTDNLTNDVILHSFKRGSKMQELGLLPADVKCDAMGVVLGRTSSERGVLIVYSKKSGMLGSDKIALVTSLAEPLSMVFRNYERIHALSALKEAAETDRDQLLIKYGRAEIGEVVIGAQKGLKNVMERVNIVAKSDLPVLIFGETGSGKEVIARAIHQQSGRNGLPFIRVNCGAIPPDLIDSELFGHERGSFTGAIDSRQGWFERADRGTLFLDEIGELPLAAQVRLLRVLQDGTFERIGGRSQRKCDVRIIAATHRNLVEMISNGTFREDLWYRLSAFPLYLPALRDRKEDISELANHFIQKAAHRFGLPMCPATPQDMNLLIQYPWPGNVRELSTVIDRATILGKGTDLKIEAALGSFDLAHVTIPNGNKLRSIDSGFQTMDQAIIEHLQSALRQTNGIVDGEKGAATLLGMNPNTLRSKMRKYKISPHRFRK